MEDTNTEHGKSEAIQIRHNIKTYHNSQIDVIFSPGCNMATKIGIISLSTH